MFFGVYVKRNNPFIFSPKSLSCIQLIKSSVHFQVLLLLISKPLQKVFFTFSLSLSLSLSRSHCLLQLTTSTGFQSSESEVNSQPASNYFYPQPSACNSSFYQCNQFADSVPYDDQSPILYEGTQMHETFSPELYTDSSFVSPRVALHCPPVTFEPPIPCHHSAMISGSSDYSSMDYGYSTQRVPLTPKDLSPSSHMEPKSLYPASEEYLSHQHYSCMSAICSFFSCVPDNFEIGPISDNGSFTIPEYQDYPSGTFTEDVWRGNLNEYLDY
eukprot:gi/632977733/ref/XP_007905510.1/ PREDICTED: uncharacterized protein LOC103187700 [Callorhinchus milii]